MSIFFYKFYEELLAEEWRKYLKLRQIYPYIELNEKNGETDLLINVAGEELNLKIKSDISYKIQFGPLSEKSATKVVSSINQK